jgi:hypothetical protein
MKTFEVSIHLDKEQIVQFKPTKITIRATSFSTAMEQITDYGIKNGIHDFFRKVDIVKTADY